ncbi:MAG TPA: hypothetical protein VGG41_19290 [Solirubrobacteraceae bacterium]|jgi:hypothetical protein
MSNADDARESTRKEILERARLLEHSAEEVHRTVATRYDSEEATAAWRQAALRHREAVEAMYSDAFWADVRRLATGEHDAVEPALVFLEADPWCFRSGYVKDELMRLLARHELTDSERDRLESVLLRVVDAGDRREFRRSCKLASRVRTPNLRRELRGRLDAHDRGVARRALLMLTSLPRARLTPSEIDRAREIVLEGARRPDPKPQVPNERLQVARDQWITFPVFPQPFDGEYWPLPSWVEELTRRFWTDSWRHQLVALAIGDGEYSDRAAKVLASAPAFDLDASEHSALTERLLRAVTQGERATPFLFLTRMLDTPQLRAQLKQRLHDPDERIARCARNRLLDLGDPDANPQP